MDILFVSSNDMIREPIPHREHYFAKYLSRWHNISVFNVKTPWKKWKKGIEITNVFLKNEPTFVEKKSFPSGNIHLNECVNLITNINELRNIFRKRKIDVIFNHDNAILGFFYPFWGKRTPMVYDFSDYLPDFINYQYFADRAFSARLGSQIIRYMMNRSLRNSMLVTTATFGLLQYAKEVGAKEVKLLSNFVDCNLFKPMVYVNIRKRYELDDNFVCGYVGTIWKNSFLSHVVKAISIVTKKYDNVKFVVAGGGYAVKDFKQLIDKFKINDHVIFMGMIPFYSVPELINAFDVCFLGGVNVNTFTWKVSRPRKLFEYMACAKPVITPRCPELERLFGVNGGPVLFADNSQEIAERIIYLIEKPQKRKELGEKARKIAQGKYHYTVVAEQLREIIEEKLKC